MERVVPVFVIKIVFVYLVLLSLAQLVSAPMALADDGMTIADRARLRQYVGGPDEADLKVQTQVVKLQKSKNETTIDADENEGF